MTTEELHPDLFGGQTPIIQPTRESDIQKAKRLANYRKSNQHEQCRNCSHLIRKHFHNRNYYKCDLIGDSNSEATDIRLHCVCDRHEPNPE